MTLYAIITSDIEDGLALRQATRPEHLDYLASLGDGLIFAGPFQTEQGSPDGSLVVVRAESLAEATGIADADPYARIGLFRSVTIRRWKWALNAPEDM